MGPQHSGLSSCISTVMNASFIEVPNNMAVVESLEKGIDILPRVSIRSKLTDIYLYPMYTIPMVYAVPEALSYSDFSAYPRNTTSSTLLDYPLITTVAVMVVNHTTLHQTKENFIFSKCG